MTNEGNGLGSKDMKRKGRTHITHFRDVVRLWVMLVPLAIYVPGILGKIPFPSDLAQYTDLLITHYPNALFMRQSILEYGSLPLWSPLIYGGTPFFANPLSGLWYPFGWPALALPLPHGLSLVLAVHALWGGWGLYKLIREEGAGHYPALLGAVAFEILPKISAHYGAGHVTLLYAIYWTPWLLLSVRRERSIIWSASCMAAIFLADPRWAAYSGILWFVYSVAYRNERIGIKLRDVGLSLGLTSMLAAPLLFPMLEFVPRSSRGQMPVEEILSHALEPVEIVGVLFPSGRGSFEDAFYAGGIVLVLALYGILQKGVRKKTIFWWGSILFSLLYALGPGVPGFSYLAEIPGFNLLRVPTRALFVFSLAWVMIAAHGLDHRLQTSENRFTGRLILVGFGIFAVFFLLGLGYVADHLNLQMIWGAGAIAAGVFLVLLFPIQNKRHFGVYLILGFAIIDGVGSGFINVDFRNPAVMEGLAVEKWLGEHSRGYGQFRTYSPSYTVSQDFSAGHNIEMVDGVDPLQLQTFVDFMEIATGVPFPNYSVTIPPFMDSPSTANKGYDPQTEWLSILNVRFLASDYRLNASNTELVYESQNRFVYLNKHWMPRAWVQPWPGEVSIPFLIQNQDHVRKANVTHWKPNKVVIEAEGPGTLVLSEMTYPGWQVMVDGETSNWHPAFQILRGVRLSQGEHTIRFIFRPWSLYLGFAAFFLATLVIYWGLRHEKEK